MAARSVVERLGIAAVVAGAAFASAAPYLYYVGTIAFPARVERAGRGRSSAEVLELELLAVAAVVVIAALAGALFAERYRLPGLGDRAALRAARPLVGVGGPALMVISYLAFGRPLAAAVPGYYPAALGWAAAMVVKGALFDEVVARYGMMTILAGVTRTSAQANAIQAVFFTAVGLKSMAFYGLPLEPSPLLVLGLVTSFALHLTQGWAYARYGLLAAIALHAVVDLKILLHTS